MPVSVVTSSIDPQMLRQAENILAKFFGGPLTIGQADLLSEPDRRNMLLRLQLQGVSSDMPGSIILKQCLNDPQDSNDDTVYSRFAHDWAAHEFIDELTLRKSVIPKFYGGCNKYNFVLIEDLGTQHVSLVNSLTGHNHEAALTALKRFMKTLGQFHAATYDKTPQYDQILLRIYPQINIYKNPIDEFLGELMPVLETVHNLLDLTIDPALLVEIKLIIHGNLMPDNFKVLTHGDICPDNVFDFIDLNHLKLIDFEFAKIRSALLDATYLKMAMPTCWCAQSIPQHLITQLEHIYRAEIKQFIPEAHDNEAYDTAYTNACGFWILNTLFFLEEIWHEDKVAPSGPIPAESLWQSNNNFARPRVITRLTAFIDIASRNNMLPHLSHLSTKILQMTRKNWHNPESLKYYAAFDQCT